MSAQETHWEIAIETDVPGQLTSRCGCGWSHVIQGASALAVSAARVAWDRHPCAGRPLEAAS